jgi:hypothetical protein
MPATEPRSPQQRKVDTLAKLAEPGADVWVATASAAAASARAHLVPLSLAWTGERIVTAVAADSRTARNAAESGRARLALGPSRDVVMIDAEVERITAVADDDATARAYTAQADWDPRRASEPYVFVVFRPVRVQSWRESNEIAGRTLMTGGRWLV